MTVLGIIENLVSDVLFVLLVLLAGWIVVRLTRRRSLQMFFGVSKSKRIVAYVSNLRVLPFGAIGLSGQKMSYQGSAVAQGEMEAAEHLTSLFRFLLPAATEPPGFLRSLLLSDVAAQILVSPTGTGRIEAQAPLISLGSPAYNKASRHIEQLHGDGPKFTFGTVTKAEIQKDPYEVRPTSFSTDTEIHVYHGGTVSFEEGAASLHPNPVPKHHKSSAIVIQGVPPITDPLAGFVYRTFEPKVGRALVYVAGLSEFSTAGAARYLATQWPSLHRKYKPGLGFLVMLKFDRSDRTVWSILFEKSFSY